MVGECVSYTLLFIDTHEEQTGAVGASEQADHHISEIFSKCEPCHLKLHANVHLSTSPNIHLMKHTIFTIFLFLSHSIFSNNSKHHAEKLLLLVGPSFCIT